MVSVKNVVLYYKFSRAAKHVVSLDSCSAANDWGLLGTSFIGLPARQTGKKCFEKLDDQIPF